MESIKGYDHYLDPPGIPKYTTCDKCHDMYDVDDLNEVGFQLVCDSCLQYIEACEQERE